MTQFDAVTLTPSKTQQILSAGKEQLSPEEYAELTDLIFDLQVYGLTPWINSRLGTLMSKIEWELEIAPSPEWEEALQACDRAFLGSELKALCYEYGMSPSGHKKELCASLYNAEVPEIVAVMEPYLKEETEERLPLTEPRSYPDLTKILNRLEELHRKDPEEFHRRQDLIRKALSDRKTWRLETMPDLTVDDLKKLEIYARRIDR
jgi:hypothetical protein